MEEQSASNCYSCSGNSKPKRRIWTFAIVMGISFARIINTTSGGFGRKTSTSGVLWGGVDVQLNHEGSNNNASNIFVNGSKGNLDDEPSSHREVTSNPGPGREVGRSRLFGFNFTQHLDFLEKISKTDLTITQQNFGP
jgi:hypothetical protein